MLENSSGVRHVVTSLKIIAVATVLGTVVMAAERHLATQLSPEEVTAAAVAPARSAEPAAPAARPAAPATDPHTTYFPSQFPKPSGAPEEQPPTF